MFKIAEIVDDLIIEGNPQPTSYIATGATNRSLNLGAGHTHYGMIASGFARVADNFGEVELSAGMYFCISGGKVEGISPDAALLVISAKSRGLRQFGGPVEDSGRLKYVSGCSDTLLLSPPRRGDPCLNHLHVPPRTLQADHYHPSDRIGIILRGSGVCRTEGRAYSLQAGMAWHIPAGLDHCFETVNERLDVITWHPDSDFGPTDEDHPMVNRTWMR